MSKPLIQRTKQQTMALREYAKKNNLPPKIYENFTVFAEYLVPSWGRDKLKWEWFHYKICDYYQAILDGELDYLTLETHSQLGKSVITALFIIYVYGCNPDQNIMYFTYNEVAATKFTKDYIFGFMGSDKWKVIFPYVVLKNDLDKGDHSSKTAMQKKRSTLKDNEFNVINPLVTVDDCYQGKYVAFGIGQGSHGRPADIMIVDDYIAKSSNINSERFRATLEQSFNSDIILRFQASTRFIIICTRWYERDPIGLLMEKIPELVQGFEEAGEEPPKFESVKIRAQYRVHDDNFAEDPRTKEGEWLWKPMLAKYLLAKNGADFEATFNCDPSNLQKAQQLRPEDFGYYYPEELPTNGRLYLCCDGASTIGKRSDKTAIGAWLVQGKKRYLIKIWYFKKEVPKLIRFVIDEIIADPLFHDYYAFLIEFANSGVTLCQSLEELHIKHTPLGFHGRALNDNIKHVKSTKDISSKFNSKKERYLRMLPEFQTQDKRIFLPQEPIEHQEELVRQMTKFTGENAHEADDLVDMCSYLINFTSANIIISSNVVKPVVKSNNGIMNYRMKNQSYTLK